MQRKRGVLRSCEGGSREWSKATSGAKLRGAHITSSIYLRAAHMERKHDITQSVISCFLSICRAVALCRKINTPACEQAPGRCIYFTAHRS